MIDLIIAVIIDIIFGDPEKLPHPVRLFGKIIAFEENKVRKATAGSRGLYYGGLIIVITNMVLAFIVPFLILFALKGQPLLHHIVNIYFLYTCIAARCLRDEAYKIVKALKAGIEEARHRLSYIVGRDTKSLSEGEIVRATVETVAENTSDGVVAPLLFAMVGGAPAACLYKMVNTMDSMLGYMNEKYRYIGFFPAKTDDLFNFIPARITGIFMVISGMFRFDSIRGFKTMVRDRKNHKSPNCAYPEGAVAGLLNIQLGGSNTYFGEVMEKPRIGDYIKPLEVKDIKNTVEIMFRTEMLLMLVYIVVEVAL